MAFKELFAATAALVLVSGVAQVSAQQSTPPAQPAALAAGPATPPAAQETAVGEMEPAAAEVEEPAEEALSPADYAAEVQRCKDSRRQALKRCYPGEFDCRAAAMRRSQQCLASLKQQ